MTNNKTIENLNTGLKMELTAMHQYQLHAHILDDWGLTKLAAKMREEQAEESIHADRFIERILFLKGDPDLALSKPPVRASSLREMFGNDLADEEEAMRFYGQAAKEAAEANDIGSRLLFEEIAVEEEGHKAWIEQQLELIERLGESVYSAHFVSLDPSAENSG